MLCVYDARVCIYVRLCVSMYVRNVCNVSHECAYVYMYGIYVSMYGMFVTHICVRVCNVRGVCMFCPFCALSILCRCVVYRAYVCWVCMLFL